MAALSDPLTGLGNRRALAEAKLPSASSLIELDLDHFKQVNDSFGHDAGDQILMQLSRVLRASVREQDQSFRLGGKEFLVLLPEADQATALLVAERIRLSVRQRDLEGVAPDRRLTVSLGVSTQSVQLSSEFSEVMDLADQALYAAKGAGRDRVCAADGLSLSHRQAGAAPGGEYPPILESQWWPPGIPVLPPPVIETTVLSGSRRLAP
ncbi:GGDEF domain-containing protein [Synechococcus sp. CCY 0621]|uniref:GGDEF domain-containing protein n=1 Tax=Synechococcus sp. CCY 0621 TaxID=2815603 RepID=UPI001C224005